MVDVDVGGAAEPSPRRKWWWLRQRSVIMILVGVIAGGAFVGWAVWDNHREDRWEGEMAFRVRSVPEDGPHVDALFPVEPLPAADPEFVRQAADELISGSIQAGALPDGARVICHVSVWWRHSEMGPRFWIERCTPNITVGF